MELGGLKVRNIAPPDPPTARPPRWRGAALPAAATRRSHRRCCPPPLHSARRRGRQWQQHHHHHYFAVPAAATPCWRGRGWRPRPCRAVRGIGTYAASLASSAACCQSGRAAGHRRGPLSALSIVHCSSHSCPPFTPCPPRSVTHTWLLHVRSDSSSLFSSA